MQAFIQIGQIYWIKFPSLNWKTELELTDCLFQHFYIIAFSWRGIKILDILEELEQTQNTDMELLAVDQTMVMIVLIRINSTPALFCPAVGTDLALMASTKT